MLREEAGVGRGVWVAALEALISLLPVSTCDAVWFYCLHALITIG